MRAARVRLGHSRRGGARIAVHSELGSSGRCQLAISPAATARPELEFEVKCGAHRLRSSDRVQRYVAADRRRERHAPPKVPLPQRVASEDDGEVRVHPRSDWRATTMTVTRTRQDFVLPADATRHDESGRRTADALHNPLGVVGDAPHQIGT